MSAHENLEHAEHAEHAAHSNKKIALLISVLALFLAFSETLGKSAQTDGKPDNIKASDTWNFFRPRRSDRPACALRLRLGGAIGRSITMRRARRQSPSKSRPGRTP